MTRSSDPASGSLRGRGLTVGILDRHLRLAAAQHGVATAKMTCSVPSGRVAVVASLAAIAAFVCGAAVGGSSAAARTPHRGLLLAVAALVEAGLVAAAAALAQAAGVDGSAPRLALVALLNRDTPPASRAALGEGDGPGETVCVPHWSAWRRCWPLSGSVPERIVRMGRRRSTANGQALAPTRDW